MIEKVVVVGVKGSEPIYIYEKGALVKQLNQPSLPALTYYYGHLADYNDSDEGDNDRIIVTTRTLKQGQLLACERADDFCSMHDQRYGKRISYFLTYDSGRYGFESKETLERSYRALASTKKNVRRYCDQLRTYARFSGFHLSWVISRY